MFDVGFQEILVIFILALLLFGPKKLPEIGRSLGKGLRELRRASNDIMSSLEQEEAEPEQDQIPESVHKEGGEEECTSDSSEQQNTSSLAQ